MTAARPGLVGVIRGCSILGCPSRWCDSSERVAPVTATRSGSGARCPPLGDQLYRHGEIPLVLDRVPLSSGSNPAMDRIGLIADCTTRSRALSSAEPDGNQRATPRQISARGPLA